MFPNLEQLYVHFEMDMSSYIISLLWYWFIWTIPLIIIFIISDDKNWIYDWKKPTKILLFITTFSIGIIHYDNITNNPKKTTETILLNKNEFEHPDSFEYKVVVINKNNIKYKEIELNKYYRIEEINPKYHPFGIPDEYFQLKITKTSYKFNNGKTLYYYVGHETDSRSKNDINKWMKDQRGHDTEELNWEKEKE